MPAPRRPSQRALPRPSLRALPLAARKMRRHKLRENVRRNNISVWVDSFPGAAFSRRLEDFAPQETVRLHGKEPLTPSGLDITKEGA